MSSLKFPSLILACLPAVSFAQRGLKDIPDPNPDTQQASMKLAPGLQLNLWASDPMIAKPIQMAWDARGRLWVASSAIYPQVKPGSTADDKIIVLEDTNGDGKADKSTVFYDGLLVPTGVWPIIDARLPAGAPGRYNAAYVANSTEVLLLRDTNGDGKADDKQIVLSGFGTEDTHHIIHSFKGAPDGCLYINQSVYIHSHIETPFGTRRMLGSGIWQYRQETGQLEMFTLGQVNPWGNIWDRWGQSFTTDGAYGEGINFAWPGATFRCLPDQRPRILKGMNPGQPKQAGLEVVNSRNFPDDWQGSVITNDFRGHRVNRFKLREDGSGYSSQQTEDVVTTTHGSFRPVDVRMGPDGGLYLADWYNPIIQHGEVDFRDERRDHVHGRIWRITGKDRPLAKVPNYEKLSAPELVALLREPEDQIRYWAKQELKTRPHTDAVAALTAVSANAPTDEARTLERVEQFNAAQTLFDAPELAMALAKQLFASTDGRARAAAVRYARNLAVAEVGTAKALAKPPQVSAFVMETLTKAVADAHPRVRLEAVNGLRAVETPAAVELAMTAIKQPVDVNLDYALWLTAWELADLWLPAFQEGKITFATDVNQLTFALKAASHKPQAASGLVKLIREGKIPQDRVFPLLQFISEAGQPDDLTLLLELAADTQKLPEAQRAEVLNSLTTAFKQRKLKPTGELNRIESLLTSAPVALQAAAARLAGTWKQESVRAPLQTLASAPATPADVRQGALEGLAAMGGNAFLKQLAETAATPDIKVQALTLLAAGNPAGTAAGAVKLLGTLGDKPELGATLINSFLKSTTGPAALAGALKDQKIPAAIATAGVQKAAAAGTNTADLQAALTAAGGLQPMAQQLTPEQMNALMAEVKSAGNAARGEAIYRRAGLTCATCHAIGAAGGIIGPNLVSLGSSAPVDYIVESLLEPSKKIKEGYATTLVTLKSNEVVTGFLSAQSATQLTMRDATGKVTQVQKNQIAKQDNVPVSLMPPGLTASLRHDEFVDLVRFLSELGKEGDYKIKGETTVRRWRVLNYDKALDVPMNKDGWRALAQPNAAFPWTPAYSLVNGQLPVADVPKMKVFVHNMSAAQCEIEVTTPGKLGVRLNDGASMHLLVGDKEVALEKNQAEFDAPAGKHTLIFVWDHTVRTTDFLQADLYEPAANAAHAQPVGGP